MDMPNVRSLLVAKMLNDFEKQIFKAPPQIAVEIILVLGTSGEIELTELYNRVDATEVATRSHLNRLADLGLVAIRQSGADKRVKKVSLDKAGEELVQTYLDLVKRAIKSFGP